jgi:hypothetical protein
MNETTITRSQIMKAAHARAKKNNTMNYRAAFSVAIKAIYWMVKHEDNIQSVSWTI